jgi:peptidoglycan-associated lipoprotein
MNVDPPNPTSVTSGVDVPLFDVDPFTRTVNLATPVYFDYDSYALRPDALETLRKKAESLQRFPKTQVQIEGHCDERGTQEYNLALGEMRAQAAREHLDRLGISRDRIITISYGEEMPAAPSHDELAWAKNRRCEFNYAGDRTAR